MATQKKYMSLEEVAEFLNLETGQINSLRESGELRGFADRGTWKFKRDNVEEYGRSMQADSSPDIPLMSPNDSAVLGDDDDQLGDQPTEIRKSDSKLLESPSDSDVRLILDDSLIEKGESDPEISQYSDEGLVPWGDSDSDVQLIGDSSTLDKGRDSDVKLVSDSVSESNSDSDVQLFVDELEDDSESDVQIVSDDSESDVKLAPPSDVDLFSDEEDSDSDVQLIGTAEVSSDSDVKLVSNTDSDFELGSDSDVRLIGSLDTEAELDFEIDAASVFSDDSGVDVLGEAVLDSGPDSGIALDSLVESGISLESADSGIALEGGESGISLEGADSGIALEGIDSGIELGDSDISLGGADSGIALEAKQDSGTSFEVDSDILFDDDSGISLSEDSGIALEDFADSGIALDGGDDDETYSLASDDEPVLTDSGIALDGLMADDDDIQATVPMMATPLLDDEMDLDDTQMEVPMLEGEDEFELSLEDDFGSDGSVILFDDEDVDEDTATTVGSLSDDGFTDEFEVMEGESLDVDDDLDDFGDSEFDLEMEDDLDVFDADDEDFSDSFETGETQSGMAAFVPAASHQMMAPGVEKEWGVSAFIGLLFSSVLMILCSMVMFDLIRSMWGWQEAAPFNSVLLETIGNLFSS